MQSIIIIEKVDGQIQGVSESQVSDEVYVAMLQTLRRAGGLQAALNQKVKEQEEGKKPKGRRKK